MNNHEILRKFKIFMFRMVLGCWIMDFELMMKKKIKGEINFEF